MKKVIITLIFALCLVSCCRSEKEFNVEYKVTYKVYYPNETVTKTYTFKGVEGETAVEVSSFRGSNGLYVRLYKARMFEEGTNLRVVESTTAPIQVTSIEKIK